ncbi:hypothetical protein GCM10023184_33780 [Flaviaesturariibacter amylovorans]|uniref:Uncharacterized protein n=1 Tax=Flaviaesturariibacter amylovorans TaxID=1084520 RepID=A0ABP8HDD5_9BACT
MSLLAMNALESWTVVLFLFNLGLLAALELVNRNKSTYHP